MTIKQILLTAAAAAMLCTTGAMADPYDHHPGPGWSDRHDHHDRDDWRGHDSWHWRDDRGGWHNDHDRYWRSGYHGYVARDRFYTELRRHHFYRWDGDPYWYHGRYVIRSYDRFGAPVFVELNPYTGGFVGVVRF